MYSNVSGWKNINVEYLAFLWKQNSIQYAKCFVVEIFDVGKSWTKFILQNTLFEKTPIDFTLHEKWI